MDSRQTSLSTRRQTSLSTARHKPDPLRMQRTVNTRFLGVLVFAAVLLTVGVHFLHGFQVNRNAADLLIRAERAYKAENLEEAIQLQSLYLGFRPKDLDALARLGQWTDESARSPRGWLLAFLTLEQVLTQDPERDDVRRRVVELAFKLRRFSDALVRLNELRERTPEIIYKIGISLEGLGRLNDAGQAYVEAIQKDEENVKPYAALISLIDRRADELDLRRIERAFSPRRASSQKESGEESIRPDPESIVSVITERMLARVKPAFRAKLAAAAHLKLRHKLPRAREFLEAALAEAPDEADVLIAMAELCLAQGDAARFAGEPQDFARYLKEAEAFANRAANRDEPELLAFLMLARISSKSNRFDEAELHIRRGLEAVAKLKQISADRKDPGLLIEWRLSEREIVLRFSLADILITQSHLQSQDGPAVASPREVTDLIDSLRRMNALPGLIGFLEARLQMGLKNWSVAAARLAAARADLVGLPDAVKRSTLLLAQCYTALEQPDSRVFIFRQSIEEDPFWVLGRLGFAAALTSVNRIDEAIAQYATVMSVPGVAITVARLVIVLQMTLPEARRRWHNAETALEHANRLDPDAPEIVVLRADLLALQKKFDEAQKLLETSRDGRPDQIEFWTGLSGLAIRRTDVDEATRRFNALKILDAAQQKFGDHVDLRIARIRVLSQDKDTPTEAVNNLKALEQGSDQFAEADQLKLLRALAQGFAALGARPEARDAWDRMARLQPEDLEVQLIRGQFASLEGDFQTVDAIVAEIRKVESPDGPNANYLEATSIVEKERLAEKPNTTALERARDQLRRAEKQRPYWAAIPHAIGVLEQILGRKEDAFTQFRKAMALGDTSREVISSVVQYLYEKRRFDEADQELRLLSETTPDVFSDDLSRLASRVAMQRQQIGDALGFVRQVDPEKRSSADLIWEAWLQFSQGKRGLEVEEPLRQAVKQTPESPQAWFALVSYLVRVDRLRDAGEVVAEAEQRMPESPKHLRPLTVAQCYELLDDVAKAEKNFRAAVDAVPDNLFLKVTLVEFLARHGQFAKAEESLDAMLQANKKLSPGVLEVVRRAKALITASQGGYAGKVKALDLLEKSVTAADALSTANLRAQATILGEPRTRRDRLKLLEILHGISIQGKPTLFEQFRLAMLYEETGNWKEAKRLLERLAHDDPTDPAYLGQLALGSMRNNDVDAAAIWLSRLRTLVPRSTAIVRLDVYLLGAQRKSRDAVARIKEFLKQDFAGLSTEDIVRDLVWQLQFGEFAEMLKARLRKTNDIAGERAMEQASRLARGGDLPLAIAILRERIAQEQMTAVAARLRQRLAARLFEQIGSMTDAEAVWRSLTENPDAPEEVFLLVSNLARQDRLDEALDLCEQAWEKCNPEIAVSGCLAALQAASHSPEQVARMAPRIEQAIAAAGNSVSMLIRLGDLRGLQERFAEAEQIYQRVLEEDPDNSFALNNLAWLLAVRLKQGDAALRLIEHALELEGPTAELLDTRAAVYLAQDRGADAIADLKNAIDDAPTPMKYFHLAQAYAATGQRSAARDALASAQGLKEQSIHPLERQSYRQLKVMFTQAQ
jgi:cellulose synthase operon protein C